MATKDGEKASEKEIYELWWEYLKRSERYKLFCDKYTRLSKVALKKSDSKYSYWDKLEELYKSELSFREDPFYYDDIIELEYNWNIFGNVFENSFDDWWKKRRILEKTLPIIVLNDPESYKRLPFLEEECLNFKNKGERFPVSEQLIKILTESESNFIFLAVPMVGNVTMEEISKQIAAIRQMWKVKCGAADYYFKRYAMPVSRVRFDELKRYLRVYDLKKQGLKMKEIITEIAPGRRGDDADVLRSFRNDLQKAKKIISNVESGCFPEIPPNA